MNAEMTMGMIFIPGMRPKNVSGAAGGSSSGRRGGTLVFGPKYRGKAHAKNLVPYEEPRTDDGRKARRAKEQRSRDVANAYEIAKYQPNTMKEKLREVRAKAAEVAV